MHVHTVLYNLIQYIYILQFTYYILYIIYYISIAEFAHTHIYIYVYVYVYIYISRYSYSAPSHTHTHFLDQQVASEGDAISATLAGQEPTCFGGMEACYFFSNI